MGRVGFLRERMFEQGISLLVAGTKLRVVRRSGGGLSGPCCKYERI